MKPGIMPAKSKGMAEDKIVFHHLSRGTEND
jgi:hypothetical protein